MTGEYWNAIAAVVLLIAFVGVGMGYLSERRARRRLERELATQKATRRRRKKPAEAVAS